MIRNRISGQDINAPGPPAVDLRILSGFADKILI